MATKEPARNGLSNGRACFLDQVGHLSNPESAFSFGAKIGPPSREAANRQQETLGE